MSVFDRLFGKGRDVALARKAEAHGELARAVELWSEAGKPEEAARVMILRGEGETDPRIRLQHYVQAVATAPAQSDVRRSARRKRAELVIALAGDGAFSSVVRRDVIEAAVDLEEIGEPAKAAAAYRRAGDTEGEVRALANAGDVERLEDLLVGEQNKDRAIRKKNQEHGDIEVLIASGRRRDALEAADARVRERPDDLALRERAQSLRARRATGPIAYIVIDGKPMLLVVGNDVVIGRTDGAILVPSHAISRKHVRIARADDAITIEDLGSRNGTQLHGMDIAGAIAVRDDMDLKIGREVPMRIRSSEEIAGAVEIEIVGMRYVAPLGPVRLPTGTWSIEEGADGWLELVCGNDHAYVGDVELEPRTTLLVGDAISRTRGGDAVLKVEG